MTTYSLTWILIADSARARLFQYDGFGAPLALLKEWKHPGAHPTSHGSSPEAAEHAAPSHGGPHPGHSSRTGMERDMSPKRAEHEHFAQQLQQELRLGLDQGAYGRLILVANPEFLGILRQTAPAQVLKHLVASVDKDYTMMPVKELEHHLAPILHG